MVTKKLSNVGRPKSLTLEVLLDTVNAMGTTSFSMKELADRLGVGVATVYRYVGDRNELLRLASARASYRTSPQDTNQPWPELLGDYTQSIFGSLRTSSALLHSYIDGKIGPELEVEFADSFIAAMSNRGFEAEQTMEIFRTIGVLAIGAAMADVHAASSRTHGGSFHAQVQHVLANRAPEELPALRATVDQYTRTDEQPLWERPLKWLIAGISASRNE